MGLCKFICCLVLLSFHCSCSTFLNQSLQSTGVVRSSFVFAFVFFLVRFAANIIQIDNSYIYLHTVIYYEFILKVMNICRLYRKLSGVRNNQDLQSHHSSFTIYSLHVRGILIIKEVVK